MSKRSPPLAKRRDWILLDRMLPGCSGENLLTEQMRGAIDARYCGGALCICVKFPAGACTF